ncbi:hypothetical protein [Aeromicrobium marinum]|nr:hypothetical protein [Aeromicrobium marinum]
MQPERRPPLDPRLAAAFYGSVVVNIIIIVLQRTTDFEDTIAYPLFLVPALLALGVTGFLTLRASFRRRLDD